MGADSGAQPVPWPGSPGALTDLAAPEAELGWRRRMRLRGPMPIEVHHGDAVVGRLLALNGLGTRYRGETAAESWILTRGFSRAGCVARHEASGAPVVRADRAGFRHKRVQLGTGQTLEWRQRGWAGRRYELWRTAGPLLLTARNTGGPLRWRGQLELEKEALELGEAASFLVLFAVFLVFCSTELHFG